MNLQQFEKQIAASGQDAAWIDQTVAQQWQQDQTLRAEFNSVESAQAYFRAISSGKVKMLRGR